MKRAICYWCLRVKWCWLCNDGKFFLHGSSALLILTRRLWQKRGIMLKPLAGWGRSDRQRNRTKYRRTVPLSGSFTLGQARCRGWPEAQLKVLELTAGKIATVFDSSMASSWTEIIRRWSNPRLCLCQQYVLHAAVWSWYVGRIKERRHRRRSYCYRTADSCEFLRNKLFLSRWHIIARRLSCLSRHCLCTNDRTAGIDQSREYTRHPSPTRTVNRVVRRDDSSV